MESGIQLKESKIPSTIEIRDPNSTDKESRIWNQEYTVRNPESKTVLDSGIQEIFACGIQNPGNICLWILESWALKRGIQIKESGTSLLIGIWNPVP